MFKERLAGQLIPHDEVLIRLGLMTLAFFSYDKVTLTLSVA